MLRNNATATDFALPDETGELRSLASLCGGKPFLLFFSRFAECPTSRRDLLTYANAYGRLRSLDADMVAITADTPESHRNLVERLELPFPILSDPDFRVSESYGVYRSDETDEGPQPHGEPAVFILDVAGRIAYSQILSGPKGIAHPGDMLMILMVMKEHEGRYW